MVKKNLNIYFFWFSVFFYFFCLMIGPRVSEDQQKKFCVRNFEINNLLGHSMNCDSADYMLNSSNPKRLLEKDSIRQARPGLIINAYVFSFLIDNFLTALTYKDEYPKKTIIKGETIEYEVSELFNPKIIFISYSLINILIIFFSIYFFFRIFDISIFNSLHYKDWLIWFSLIIVVNNTVNQFFWSPSTKLLNIFCSVFTIYFSSQIFNNKLSINKIFLINLFCGFLLLYYAVFFISFIIFNSLFLLFYSKKYFYILINTLLFVIPFGLWFTFIKFINGDFFFSQFTDYNFIFWISDSLSESGFLKTLYSIINGYFVFFMSVLSQSFLLIFFLIFMPLIFLNKKKILFKNSIFFSSVIFLFFYVSFFVILGHTPKNITACSIIPLVVIFVSILKDNRKSLIMEREFKKIFIFVFPVYYFWSIFKFGPYS